MARVENEAGRIPTCFFEDFPLYKPVAFWESMSECVRNVIPAVRLECPKCKSEQTFGQPQVSLDFSQLLPGGQHSTTGKTFRITMRCAGCERFEYHFLVHFREDEKHIEKVGQHPKPTIRIDKGLDRALGAYSDRFRRGLISESQGFGIGAFGYYRRIVEGIIGELLESLQDILPPEKQGEYASALSKTKASRRAQEKIDLVKDLLPDSLRPNGLNPLGVLHHALSEGLHSLEDEECLGLAMQIREVLEYLVSQVSVAKESKRKFTEGMKRLLEKKSAADGA